MKMHHNEKDWKEKARAIDKKHAELTKSKDAWLAKKPFDKAAKEHELPYWDKKQ